jgi:hypothetical protein
MLAKGVSDRTIFFPPTLKHPRRSGILRSGQRPDGSTTVVPLRARGNTSEGIRSSSAMAGMEPGSAVDAATLVNNLMEPPPHDLLNTPATL